MIHAAVLRLQALYQGTTSVVPLEFVHFQRPGILLVPAPDFQSGERVFKPAETFGLSIKGFSSGGCEPALYQGTTLVVPIKGPKNMGFSPWFFLSGVCTATTALCEACLVAGAKSPYLSPSHRHD